MLTKDKIIKKDKEYSNEDFKELTKTQILKRPKEGYSWFFDMEICEQPDCVKSAINGRISDSSVKLGGIERKTDEILNTENLIINACGSSLYAGMYGQLILKMFRCINTVECISGSDIDENDLYRPNTTLLTITQSGETQDCLRALKLAKSMDLLCFNVINDVNSTIGRETQLGISLE